MFFAFAGILFKHPIFPTALKEKGRSGSFLSRSEQRVPVVSFVGHLIAILTGDFIMLFLIVVLVGPVMYKNTKFFFFAQYYTDYDIYIFRSSTPWRVLRHGSVARLELSHGTIGAVPSSKNLLKLFRVLTASFWLPSTEPPAEDHYFFLNESS